MCDSGNGVIPQLFLFKDFKYDGPNITYEQAESQLKSIFQLLKNEVIDFCFPFKLIIPHDNELTLYATNWAIRVIFTQKSALFRDFVVPLKTVIKMEKEGHESIKMGKFGIKIYFSTGGHLMFEFPKIEGIRSSFIKRIEYLKKCHFNFPEGEWIPNPSWVHHISDVSHYDIMKNEYCKTYPLYFVIPKNIPLYYIHEISRCRSHDRFPIISYFYIPKGTNDKIALLRSSQPLTLFKKPKRAYEHEYLSSVCGDHGLTIIDCRQKKYAVAYEFIGKGYESTKRYKKHISHVDFHFLGIPHAYKVRAKYASMLKSLFHGKSSAFKKWGELTMQILDGASFVANSIVVLSNAVLVHCSDGWDRTSQICALSQLLIDPYFRTINGFVELIQKDWMDMGHLFTLRCGHVKSVDFDEACPIFAQFIDAVAQLINKYPAEFEFNLTFLEIILSNAYSQLFGDFMGNNYIERLEMKRPTSLFVCFDDDNFGFKDKIKNVTYQKSDIPCLQIKKNEDYKFFPELLGSPVFFSNDVPLIKCGPPLITNYKIYDLERISLENRKERKIAQKNKKDIDDDDDNEKDDDNDDEDDDLKNKNNENSESNDVNNAERNDDST